MCESRPLDDRITRNWTIDEPYTTRGAEPTPARPPPLVCGAVDEKYDLSSDDCVSDGAHPRGS